MERQVGQVGDGVRPRVDGQSQGGCFTSYDAEKLAGQGWCVRGDWDETTESGNVAEHRHLDGRIEMMEVDRVEDWTEWPDDDWHGEHINQGDTEEEHQ